MNTPSSQPQAEATPGTTPLRPSPWWTGVAAAVLAAFTALAAAGWWWSGSEGSLATALRVVSRWLPTGLSLHSTGAQGSLRHGGQVASLQWRQDGLALDLQDLRLSIDSALLLQGQWPMQTLQLGRLEVRPLPAQHERAPAVELVWPLKVQLSWRIDTLRWLGTAPLEATGLRGHYRFDGAHHHLSLDSLQSAQGHYQGQLLLQARAPMALDVRVQGEPSWPAGHLHQGLQAQAQLQGTLSGPQASLELEARISSPTSKAVATPTPQLTLQAKLQPHARQPIAALQARLQQIDLAMLWTGAPQTQLNGTVQVGPDKADWQLALDLRNAVPGPWDRGRLPLERLQAQCLHVQDGWQLQTLQARWPGGGVQGQGHGQDLSGQGQWQVTRLQLGQWLSAWQGPALSGQIGSTRTVDGRVQLQARLQPESPMAGTDPDGLRLEAEWHEGSWNIARLDLHGFDAQLRARGRWTPAKQELQALTQWQLPGLTARLEGELSPHQGQGQWQLDAQDTARLWAWLQRWPALRERLQGWSAPGMLQANGHWQGGWAGEGMQLHSRLVTPRLQVQAQTRLGQVSPGSPWQGQLRQFQADWAAGTAQGAAGQFALQTPLDWQWQAQTATLQWQAHRWALQGPASTAALLLEPGHWQAPRQPGALPVADVRAKVTDLPLQWAAWLGLPEVQGDLSLQGGLDLKLQEQPQLQLWLERSRGDVQVVTDLASTPRVQAGVRTARASLNVQGAQARLELAWDSTQAGQLEAHLQSHLDLSPQQGLGGLWPTSAPLAGEVSAHLPRVGAWSWLAPPGWRVQGSLDARVALAGTRGQPQWTGTVQADNLAVRSAVEGIEFRQGRLRARLQEQQMLLEEFRLLGAGAQGGEVSAQGRVRWLAQAGPPVQALQMDLQMQAQGLRVTNRADRRLSVSGQVRAQLERGQMQLRGRLQADSAWFILPDDNTPTLGKDVFILNPRSAGPPAAPSHGPSVMSTPDIQVLLDLGPDFQLRGQGITTRLAGQVQLSSNATTAGQPRLAGQVRTEGGRYKAYGQQLDIEQGLLRFTGPYDNPGLDIVALRPNLGQRVGVRVSGTAQAPRIRLYADPDMPEADKLAWLVLGRSPAAGGAESAVLQQAALALLGGNGKNLGGELASALGFDEVSLASRTATTPAGTTATGTAVMLGKRLSRDFYLAYESSVSGAFGSLFIFYDLSRRLALRAQTGELNALDLLYTIRHD